jgi:hypothetical protein
MHFRLKLNRTRSTGAFSARGLVSLGTLSQFGTSGGKGFADSMTRTGLLNNIRPSTTREDS